VHTGFRWRDLRKRDDLEVYGIDGSIIFKRIFNKWDGGIDWIDLAQHGDRWESVVDTVMNIRFS
jgi:hypothetical protein